MEFFILMLLVYNLSCSKSITSETFIIHLCWHDNGPTYICRLCRHYRQAFFIHFTPFISLNGNWIANWVKIVSINDKIARILLNDTFSTLCYTAICNQCGFSMPTILKLVIVSSHILNNLNLNRNLLAYIK